MIEVVDLRKTYRMGGSDVHALDGVSFSIKAGELVAVVGPSGSGKSTLMNLLGCLDVPSAGRYLLDGVEVNKQRASRLATIRNRKIGFVFQQFNLLAQLSALENVALPLMYRGLGNKERRQRAAQCLEQVGLADRVHHRPSQLSGGQQQRVAIARALAGAPPLLLADEPTGNLDSRSGQEVIQLLRQLNAAGNTILLITHDLEVARQAQRWIRIQDGKITEDRMVKEA